MGQAAKVLEFDADFPAFDADSELEGRQKPELCCIVMYDGDDFPMSLDAVREQSQYDLHLVRTRSIAETNDAIAAHDADLLLLGNRVSDGDGLAFARTLSADARTCDVPVIMISDENAETIAIEVLRAGAADVISSASVTYESFDQAIENALRRRRQNPADHLAVISNLESENATLRRIALRNMRLLKTEALPLLSFAWQAMKERSIETAEEKRLAQRLSRITRTMMGLIDDTVITSATHRALDVAGPVNLRSVADRILEDDCGEIRLSSAHFIVRDLPTLFVRESIATMLFEELFVSMVRNARFGHVSEIEVGSGCDPNGHPIIWLVDAGVPLSARKQTISQRFKALNDLGSPRQDALTWSLCQRLTEKCGGDFKISETASGQVRISLRFPAELIVNEVEN